MKGLANLIVSLIGVGLAVLYFQFNPTFHSVSFISSLFQRIANGNNHAEHRVPEWKDQTVIFAQGKEYLNWKVLRVTDIPELRIQTIQLEHKITGAHYLHAASNDTNNFFSVSFRTPPSNNTGISHVLEHLVLCGSKKYPFKDPFFAMLRRSLNTYMNAWTASDHTTYLFSSFHEKDYFNLMDVYLDAVFFPLLRQEDFDQEAWRFEKIEAQELDPEQQNATDVPYKIQGVVFNEMKAVVSDPISHFMYSLNRYLYNGSTYGCNSGGDPLDIPSLDLMQLREFHKTFYDPSNSLFYSYGDIPLRKHLEFVEEHVFKQLNSTESKGIGAAILEGRYNSTNDTSQVMIKNMTRVEMTGPLDPASVSPPEKQVKFAVGFITNEAFDEDESFALAVIGKLLMRNPKGPLYRSLISSGLAPDFMQYSGYEAADLFRNRTSFIIGVTGISEDKVPVIEQTIYETLKNFSLHCFIMSDRKTPEATPIRDEDIDAILNQIELGTKELSPRFGSDLALSIIPHWVHGGNTVRLVNALKVEERVARFRKNWKENGCFLENKMKHYLFNNERTVTMVMKPDQEYLNIVADKEKEIVKKYLDLYEIDKPKYAQNTLKEKEDGEKLANTLPSLSVEDIPKKIPYVLQGSFHKTPGTHRIPVYYYDTKTNGIAYISIMALVEKEKIPESMMPYLPILSTLLPSIGAGEFDHIMLSERTDYLTGGIGASHSVIPKIDDFGVHKVGLKVSSKCLQKNVKPTFELLRMILTEPHFNNTKYIKTLIEQELHEMSESITSEGHRYAEQLAASSLHDSERLDENLEGLTQLKFLRELAAKFETNEDEVIVTLKQLYNTVVRPENLKILITFEAKGSRGVTEEIDFLAEAFLRQLQLYYDTHKPNQQELIVQPDQIVNFQPEKNTRTFVAIPFPVNYVARSILTVPLLPVEGDIRKKTLVNLKHHAHLEIIASLIQAFLHLEIREKGGAYGSTSSHSLAGILSMSSYRDPNINKTLQTFEAAIKWVCVDNGYKQNEITEAKLRTFQRLDRPTYPADKAGSLFVYGIDDDLRQEFRDAVLRADRDQIKLTCNEILLRDDPHVSSAVLGSDQAGKMFTKHEEEDNHINWLQLSLH